MTAIEHQVKVWQEAAQDLGLNLNIPFSLRNGDQILTYLGLLLNFGGNRGTAIIFEDPVDLERQKQLTRTASACGYGFSCISVGDVYNRENFIDFLNEWGWCGPAECIPSWYSPWSEKDEKPLN